TLARRKFWPSGPQLETTAPGGPVISRPRHNPLRFRSAPAAAGVERRRVDLEVRAGTGDTLLVRASNDTLVDHYGTVITAEALLRDWWAGYQQHRTVSLQHNLPELRGIAGRPNVGRATRVDFTPQLEVEIKVLDPEVVEMVREGKIGSASLEFVPLDTERREIGRASGGRGA